MLSSGGDRLIGSGVRYGFGLANTVVRTSIAVVVNISHIIVVDYVDVIDEITACVQARGRPECPVPYIPVIVPV